MMTCLGLVCPGIFLLFFSAVNNLALAVMFVHVASVCFMLVINGFQPNVCFGLQYLPDQSCLLFD